MKSRKQSLYDFVLEIADRAYVLDRGKVVANDSAQNIVKSDILEKVFMGKFDLTPAVG